MSNIPLLILRPHRILAALVATSAVAALIPVVAIAGGPKADGLKGHHLVFRVSGPDRRNVFGTEAVDFVAHCPTEDCAVVASVAARVPPSAPPK